MYVAGQEGGVGGGGREQASCVSHSYPHARIVLTRSVLASLAHSLVGRCMHNGRSVDECIFKFPAIAHACQAIEKVRANHIEIFCGSQCACSLPNWKKRIVNAAGALLNCPHPVRPNQLSLAFM